MKKIKLVRGSRDSAKWRIQDAIAREQMQGDWKYRNVIKEVHRAVSHFQIFLFKQEKLPPLVFGIGKTRQCALGHFRGGFNDFGIQHEVKISEAHVIKNANPKGWHRVLGTVLHECLHAHQLIYGKPGKPPYHNKQFRQKASEFGLAIDHRGVTEYRLNSPFTELLEIGNFVAPLFTNDLREHQTNKLTSRNCSWTCSCARPVRIRVCRSEVFIRCEICGCLFEPTSS